MMAIKTCTEFYSYKRWSEECKFDIKPMVEIIVHESDQEMLTLAINLFLKVCSYIDDENFGIVKSSGMRCHFSNSQYAQECRSSSG
ncbi:hypothetical protein BDV3_003373 [Batrachochytrium dendrobatidis]